MLSHNSLWPNFQSEGYFSLICTTCCLVGCGRELNVAQEKLWKGVGQVGATVGVTKTGEKKISDQTYRNTNLNNLPTVDPQLS